MLFIINESVALWNICKSELAPIFKFTLSNKSIALENLISNVSPSTLKYSAIPPEPSSDWNLISLSLANWDMNKSPVSFFILVSVPSWKIAASPPSPKNITLLSILNQSR